MNCESSRQLWEKLESIYQSKGPAHKAHLLKSLILQKMKNGDDMHSPLQRFLSILTNREMDMQVMDDLVTIQLLYSVPEEYEHFRVAIETQDNIPEPEMLKTKMMEEYEARKKTTLNWFTMPCLRGKIINSLQMQIQTLNSSASIARK